MDSMLGFKQFVLYEMAKTIRTERHIDKYVRPYIDNGESPLTTAVTLHTLNGREIPKGSQIIPYGGLKNQNEPVVSYDQKIHKNGARKGRSIRHISAKIITPDGETLNHYVPHTAIKTPTENDGKHNYEHAVRALWNFSTKNKNLVTGNDGKLNLDRLKSEVEKSKTDKNHPLHHIHSSEDEFGGGVKNSENAKKTRHLNLQAAAHTVHSLANHEDIEKHFHDKSEMTVSGSGTAPMSQLYHSERVKNDEDRHNKAKDKFDEGEKQRLGDSNLFPKQYTTRSTRKDDAVVVGKVHISLKQTKAQGSSGGASESSGIIKHSLNVMRTRKIFKDKPEEFEAAVTKTHKRLDEMREHMNEGRHIQANEILQGILDNPIWANHKSRIHPHGINQLHVHMAHESLSGAGKFQRSTSKEQKKTKSRYTSEQGPATHMATVPLEGGKLSTNPADVSVTRLTHGNVADLIKDGTIGRPSITTGKNPESDQSVMRIPIKGKKE
tara:strand:+ start:1821 stop:3302 length:1482 start_codon:yes stop_codon:yes gene_type:complete